MSRHKNFYNRIKTTGYYAAGGIGLHILNSYISGSKMSITNHEPWGGGNPYVYLGLWAAEIAAFSIILLTHDSKNRFMNR